MAEKPILFSAPMIRALLAGTKTQTRRVCKQQPSATAEFCRYDQFGSAIFTDGTVARLRYAVGDVLWARETWAVHEEFDAHVARGERVGPGLLFYRADADDDVLPISRWRPSIHLPRWASRLSLEVTEVRCQRLQDISEADAGAEGCEGYYLPPAVIAGEISGPDGKMPSEEYRDLWDSINGKTHPWASNPWVFAYTFKQLEAANDR